MGRLFWKFFLSILLAQVAATVGIGGAFWLNDVAHRPARPADIDTSPPAQLAIDAAVATLEYGGTDALRNLLANMERQRVYAVDETGRDLLGRVVSQSMLIEAHYVMGQLVMGQPDRRRVVRQLSARDGHTYLLFLPSRQHQGGFDIGYHGAGLGLLAGEPLGPLHLLSGPRVALPGAQGAAPSSGPGAQAGETAASADAPRAGPPGPDGRRPPLDPRYRAAILIAAAILASLLFAFLLAWYFARPIRQLRLAFEAASGGDLAPRFGGAAGKGGDELSDLGRDFDRMTARLRSLMDDQTRLLHDVSHELRSPLARLQAAIGLAHQQPEQMSTSMERIERESVRMDKLVGELLTLSRLEAGALHALKEEISLADLIDDIVADASFEAKVQQRSVHLTGTADVTLTGQPDLLARALDNVVRNAIKHSPPGGVVELDLCLQQQGRALSITVRDSGPGVAECDLDAIFKPFFRGAGSAKNTDGHGLGLAIAQHVVQVHGGCISARNRPEGGLCVEIVLPVRPRLQGEQPG